MTTATGQWFGNATIKIATFHTEIMMESTQDFKSVMTQKDRV
jgi:hypothetical protein